MKRARTRRPGWVMLLPAPSPRSSDCDQISTLIQVFSSFAQAFSSVLLETSLFSLKSLSVFPQSLYNLVRKTRLRKAFA